ncbi:sodium-solute symporter putative [Vibrio maritimus]|uniref:Sodium-solute symporter putative n=1 Tax=Vibrio maritimus TaxID=990268 RepID=A0A090RYQ6_9VIBR|nr:sodium-solute symporter putative [Vibrio maritimus]
MPSWFIAGQGVDLAAHYPDAGSKAGDFAYLYFVQDLCQRVWLAY